MSNIDIDTKFQKLHRLSINEYMSFYDFIRIYTVNDLIEYQKYLNIPLDYVTMNNMYRWDYNRIALTITYVEFLYYDQIRNILLEKYITHLSFNENLPLKFIIKNMTETRKKEGKEEKNKWDWWAICRYNQTFQESDLDKLESLGLLKCDALSYNQTVLLEWILARSELISHGVSLMPGINVYSFHLWDYSAISGRLSLRELKRLYNQDKKFSIFLDKAIALVKAKY